MVYCENQNLSGLIVTKMDRRKPKHLFIGF